MITIGVVRRQSLAVTGRTTTFNIQKCLHGDRIAQMCRVLTTEKTATFTLQDINPLTPNDDHSGRTAPLTSKCCVLYIYSTKIGTEYFKHGVYSPFFPLKNAICFIILTYLVPVLFTFYIQNVLKLKKIIPAPKG